MTTEEGEFRFVESLAEARALYPAQAEATHDEDGDPVGNHGGDFIPFAVRLVNGSVVCRDCV